GAETETGDGAGILIQIPDAFFREVTDFELPEPGTYAAGTAFLPQDETARGKAMSAVERIAAEENLRVLGWRDMPVDAEHVGPSARETMPYFAQVFLAPQRDGDAGVSGLELERAAFVVRKRAEHQLEDSGVYFPSLSSRTIVYKGMLTEPQVPKFFSDLADERVVSAIGLVHSRFSTNSFPSWPLAHPYRYVAHNGEINTLK